MDAMKTPTIIQDIFSGFLNSQRVAQEYNKANEPVRKTHEEWEKELEANREKQRIYYRGYTIEPTLNGCPYGGYDYYPTEDGRDEDIDWNGNPCGNVGFTNSIASAKREIDDLIYEKMHVVVLNEGEGIYEHRHEFENLENAIDFATMWGGNLYPNGQPIINP